MKLRIAQMGDGMFEVQERKLFFMWRNTLSFQFRTLESAQAALKELRLSEAARTVVRVWE